MMICKEISFGHEKGDYYKSWEFKEKIEVAIFQKAIPFFFFAYRRMRSLILSRSVGLTKKKPKPIVGPGTPGQR